MQNTRLLIQRSGQPHCSALPASSSRSHSCSRSAPFRKSCFCSVRHAASTSARHCACGSFEGCVSPVDMKSCDVALMRALALLCQLVDRRVSGADSNGAGPAVPYDTLETLQCNLSTFPNCDFFRVEVRISYCLQIFICRQH